MRCAAPPLAADLAQLRHRVPVQRASGSPGERSDAPRDRAQMTLRRLSILFGHVACIDASAERFSAPGMDLQPARRRHIGRLYTRGSSARASACACSATTTLPPGGSSCAKALSNVSGFPRIGAQRELKRRPRRSGRGQRSQDELLDTARDLRAANWKLQRDAGHRPDPVQRLLVLRPGARHDRAGRRGARALRLGRARATSTSTPTSRWRAAARAAAST